MEVVALSFSAVTLIALLGVIVYAVYGDVRRLPEVEHKAAIYRGALLMLGKVCMDVDWNCYTDLDRNAPTEESMRDSYGWRDWAVEEYEKRIEKMASKTKEGTR